MSIRSSAFGGVVLSGEDAEKFLNQVRYGRPKKAATETVKRGSAIAKALHENGHVKLNVKNRKPVPA